MEKLSLPFDLPLIVDWIGIAVAGAAIVYVRRLRVMGKTLDRAATYFMAGIAVFMVSLVWERIAEGFPALGLPGEEPHHFMMMTSMLIFAYASSKFEPTKDELVKEIAERSKAEALLAESELKFRTLTENAPVGISLLDENANLMYINKAGQEVTRVPEAELLGAGWRRYLHPDDLAAAASTIGESFKARRGYSIDVRMIRKDGTVRWTYSQVAPINAKAQHPIFVATSVDITEAKEASLALQKRTDELEKVMKLMVGREKEMIQLKRRIRKDAESGGETP